ncbi:putative beta-glucuronidase [Neohortaea acidophila]|uniref:Putative beta-glucuronidase n=1 Tax=Neohortaea acidophila TaxID=245834 RepID=A0A6A6Q1J1_9PEZI|nr:putative beta-glucuronidase [Neohortaea acidophila]KAF2485307.1 putative beta-glucuronidase [Neohortaea acidophila]
MSEAEYPRPDFVRASLRWQSLNGPWDFLFDDDDVGLARRWQGHKLADCAPANISLRTIQVPFVFQSKASGIHERSDHEVLWYERSLHDFRTNEERSRDQRVLLRFGAVDYHATVWVDGKHVGEHRGGHVPFQFDITDFLAHGASTEQTSRVTIRVFDSATDLTQPRGKQFWEAESKSIYYTPSSGIWQNVWMELGPPARIADSSHGTVIRSDDIEAGRVNSHIALVGRKARHDYYIEVEASLAGVHVSKSGLQRVPKDKDSIDVSLNMRLSQQQLHTLPAALLQQAPLHDQSCWRDGLGLWSPEYPLLYNLTVRLYDSSGTVIDEVWTITGMRSINWTTGDGTFRLNGQPYFQALLLDQGYWPDTIMTPPNEHALKRDIELSKSLGFNGCRKHQKVEDPAFLYWADRLGFLVWGEMASAFDFSLEYTDRFDQEWVEMVRRDINHPCVVAWTPANESWGYPDLQKDTRQRDHLRSLYYMTRTLDPTRPINDNCGWEHVITDLSTFHDYADAPGMAKRCASVQSIVHNTGRAMFLNDIHGPGGAYDAGSRHLRGAPILCTEFGGVNIAGNADSSQKKNWGYTTAKDSQDLLARVERIVMATVEKGHICGVVWTQFTDIEQEQNGLFTFDRKEKLPAEQVKRIMQRAAEVYHANRLGA